MDCTITELMSVTDEDELIADWEVAERKIGTADLFRLVCTGKLWKQVNCFVDAGGG